MAVSGRSSQRFPLSHLGSLLWAEYLKSYFQWLIFILHGIIEGLSLKKSKFCTI